MKVISIICMSSKKSKKRTVSLCQTSKSPRSSTSKSGCTSRINTSPSGRSPKFFKNSVKKSDRSADQVSRSVCNTPSYSFPTHLEVIDRLRKMNHIGRIMPFSPEIPPAVIRNIHSAYSKPSLSLMSRMKNRKEKIEFPLPEDKKMDKFLKRIKETERIIRQEQGFVGKIRRFKPKIQLDHSTQREETPKVKRIKTRKNSTPTKILRSGINASKKSCSASASSDHLIEK